MVKAKISFIYLTVIVYPGHKNLANLLRSTTSNVRSTAGYCLDVIVQLIYK